MIKINKKKIHFFLFFISIFLISCSKDLKKNLDGNLSKKKISEKYKKENIERKKREQEKIYLLMEQKRFLDVLKMYDKTTSIEIRKDKKIIDFLATKILSEVDKKETELKKVIYLKNSIVLFPYSKKITELYLDLSWKNQFSLIDAIDNYIKYKNIFGNNNNIFKKMIYYTLNYFYHVKNEDPSLLRLMVSLNIEESSRLFENLMKKNSYIINNLDQIPDLKIELLTSLLENPNFINKKEIIKQFLKKGSKEKLLTIYNKVDENNKLSIYYNYFIISKEEIDKNLIDNFLNKDGKNYHKIAFRLIKEFKLVRYKEKLLKYMPLYQSNCSSIRKLLIETLIEINPEFVTDYFKKIDSKELKNIQKIIFCNLKDKLKLEQSCDFPEIIKSGTENEKAEYLKLILSQKREIPKYFIDNFKNIYYIQIFSDNYKQLPLEILKKMSYLSYLDGNIDLLLKYFDRVDKKKLKNILNSKLPKYVKKAKLGKDTLRKLVYLSLLEKDYENEIFIVKKYIAKTNIFNKNFAKLLVSRLRKQELFWLLRLININTQKDIQIIFIKGIIKKL